MTAGPELTLRQGKVGIMFVIDICKANIFAHTKYLFCIFSSFYIIYLIINHFYFTNIFHFSTNIFPLGGAGAVHLEGREASLGDRVAAGRASDQRGGAGES